MTRPNSLSSQSALGLLVLCGLSTACDYDKGTGREISTFVDESATDLEAEADYALCSFDFSYLGTNRVHAVCLVGEANDATVPEIPHINFLSPCDYGTPVGWNDRLSFPETYRERQHPEYLIEAASDPNICEAFEADTGNFLEWKAYWENWGGLTCEDYTAEYISFLVVDGLYFVWDGLVSCPTNNEGTATGSPDAYAGNTVMRGPGACVPGTADFQAHPRSRLASDDTLASYTLTPLATTPVQLHEAASIRSIEVLDFGDASSVHIGNPHELLETSGLAFVGGLALSPSAPSHTFAAGQLPMSTPMGMAGVQRNAQYPTLRMSWTCEDTTPSVPLDLGNTYRFTPPAVTGVAQDIVIWVDTANQRMVAAPEGRFVDHTVLPIEPGGVWKNFSGWLPLYSATLTGEMRVVNGRLRFRQLEMSTEDGPGVALPNQDLPSFP